jgi:hypothetical protein
MRAVWIIAGLGLCALFGAVMWFAPKLENKADLVNLDKDVQVFGKVYLKYQKDNGRPPRSLEELQPLVARESPRLRERVKNDEFTVIWGARIGPELPESRAKAVIVGKPVVHGKQVVIHQDGTVRHYTPEEIAKLVMATAEEGSSGAR